MPVKMTAKTTTRHIKNAREMSMKMPSKMAAKLQMIVSLFDKFYLGRVTF